MNKLEQVCWGAMVADAASMGFHWVYEQERIRLADSETPEFRDPMEPLPKGDFTEALDTSFIYRGRKKPGDSTQYGEHLLVMMRAMAECDGKLDQAAFEKEFARHFGPGGDYVGYCDRATEVVLFNMKKRERDIYDRFKTTGDFDLTREEREVLDDEVMAELKLHGSSLDIEEHFEHLEHYISTKSLYQRDPAKHQMKIDYCRKLFREVRDLQKTLCGDVGDDQFVALAKFPPLISRYCETESFLEMVELATRLTHNNDTSVEYGIVYAEMLRAAILKSTREAVVEAAKTSATPAIRTDIDKSLSMVDVPNTETAEFFGLSCHLPYGLPYTIHLIVNTDSYVDAIRKNILAAGDSAGRGIMIGAIYAALHGIGTPDGVPKEWMDRLTHQPEIRSLIAKLT